jgi:polysaccharide export outer membrane protein
MRAALLNGKARVVTLGTVLVVLWSLFDPSMVVLAQQPKATAPDATAPGGRPVAPNRPAGARGGFDAPGPNEAARPAPEAAKPAADAGGPSAHRVSRSGVSTYPLGTGDIVRITVFQQPDLGTETRVTESGTLTFPLLGPVEVVGLNTKELEAKIAGLLKARGFVKDPQVTVTITQFKSRQISIIGHVNRPGRYPLEEGTYSLTETIALAGGVSEDASDEVLLLRQRDGKTITVSVDLPTLFRSNGALTDPEVIGGDTIYVDRYPYYYVYGEVQRPGVYRLQKGMTLMQALSVGGGFTMRASRKDVQVNRRDAKTGKITTFVAQLNDLLLPDDVIYIKESLF